MRTTIVSTKKLKEYKISVFVIDGIILMFLIGYLVYLSSISSKWYDMAIPIIIYLQFHMFYHLFLNLRNVSYDDGSVFYDKDGYEVQVPFEDILSIEIRSVTGIYSIKLLNPSQGKNEILFKTSVWYPWNFQKKDDMVNELRDKINSYKRSLPDGYFNLLPSYRL